MIDWCVISGGACIWLFFCPRPQRNHAAYVVIGDPLLINSERLVRRQETQSDSLVYFCKTAQDILRLSQKEGWLTQTYCYNHGRTSYSHDSCVVLYVERVP